MKPFLLFISSLICVNSIAQDAYKQYVSYDVPIHVGLKTNYLNEIESFSKELTLEELDRASISRLNNDVRKKMAETIFNKLLSGAVTAYVFDENLYAGNIKYQDPTKYFQVPIAKENIKDYLSYVETYAVIDEEGYEEYDEIGNPVYQDYTYEYTYEDIVCITFYEEWTIDAKTNEIKKEIKGYTPNVVYNSDQGDYVGLVPLVYIACDTKPNKKAMVISKNMESYTKVCYGEGDYTDVYFDQWWWGGLLPNIRNPFVGKNDFAPFLSLNKTAKLYECNWNSGVSNFDVLADFPYKKELSEEEIKHNTSVLESFPVIDEYGEYKYDEEGFPIYEEVVELFVVKDIKYLGFIEEWKFDEKTLSISKTIKGVMPVVYFRDENGDKMGLHPMFCLQYQ
ncbi:MAG: hypothetical protein ACI9N1_001282 [Flavobacteriales bacterium]|jgi:hypothetical protein